ncbi:MAG: 23S rRNA (pseudouridine(1915)-N(3))-methyltransferase RlmH [Candidatus Accumulibacter sp.]|jgi:23S rRNA (pseudouridine1915-N3)-methyltransferase|nr:23S rRNA (pseudouridine(1915)-N(3))-methyltransferase RlmH [Accumulibacter sp.]
MKFLIFAVGHKLPAWVESGCAEYIRRMPRELSLSMVEIRPEPGGAKTRAQRLSAEKARLLLALRGYERIIALDERGADITTLELAERLESWMRQGGDTAFVVGGAEGLDEEIKRHARETLRLSSLTLPHAMARLLLCEQLYRAVSILRNHPYHRE